MEMELNALFENKVRMLEEELSLADRVTVLETIVKQAFETMTQLFELQDKTADALANLFKSLQGDGK